MYGHVLNNLMSYMPKKQNLRACARATAIFVKLNTKYSFHIFHEHNSNKIQYITW